MAKADWKPTPGHRTTIRIVLFAVVFGVSLLWKHLSGVVLTVEDCVALAVLPLFVLAGLEICDRMGWLGIGRD